MAAIVKIGQRPAARKKLTPNERRWSARAMMAERRYNRRTLADAPLRLRTEPTRITHGRLRNVSRTGMFIETTKPLPAGTRLRIEIEYSTHNDHCHVLTLPIFVIHTTEQGMGVEVGPLNGTDCDRYSVFINHCQGASLGR